MLTISPGSDLAGYRIEELIGRGGMGSVFRAEHQVLRRKAALKTLLPELAADEAFRERFIHESQLVAAIEHPNIIPIYDAGYADGVTYIAMRLVDGEDLAALIVREAPLEPERALSILGDAGAALDAAHGRDVVHRDVKPANVLIDGVGGRTYLTDFGIAQRGSVQQEAEAGEFAGTLDYAAPEQLEAKEVGPTADVYALACVLFEALTRQRPFERETDVAVLYAHLLDPPPAATELRPELPAAIDDVLARGLAKAADERFADCRSLVEAARAVLGRAALAVIEEPREGLVSNLPRPPSPLVGRREELVELTALLGTGEVRLVTLLGPGGTGKTRLALEVAKELPELGPSIFVDLAAVRDPRLVGAAVGEAFGVVERPGQSVVEAISARIGEEGVLGVLDNFEHVVGAANLVAELLDAVPGLKLLITSQAPLRLSDERQYPVAPLEVPSTAMNPAELTTVAAVQLFLERARAVKPGFEVTAENASAVAELCVRLDGLPLALELAAARMKLLTPAAVLERLGHRFEVLTAGARDLPERQQTLRGAIDWSYGLLDEREQSMLARLGVFVGGCSLESAEAVCGAPDDLDLGDVLDLVASLVDKSLVQQHEDAVGEPRFRVLETIREYALERLEELDEIGATRRLHAERYLALAEMAEPELTRSAQATWLARLDEEHGNLRAALAWSLDAGELEVGLRIAAALPRFWSTRGHMSEGRRWLASALEGAQQVSPAVRARALFADGYAALGEGDFHDAVTSFEQSLRTAREIGDARLEGAALAQLAWLAMARGDDSAGQLAQASLDRARPADDKLTVSGALNVLAELALGAGDRGRAVSLYEESLALRRALGDDRLIANSLLNLGRAALVADDATEAEELLRDALTLARRVRDTWSESVALVNLGRVALLGDDPARARAHFGSALAIANERADKRLLAECVQGVGATLVDVDPERAGRLWGAAAAALTELGAAPSAVEQALVDRFLPRLRARTGDAEFVAAEASGRSLSLAEAVDLASDAAAR